MCLWCAAASLAVGVLISIIAMAYGQRLFPAANLGLMGFNVAWLALLFSVIAPRIYRDENDETHS